MNNAKLIIYNEVTLGNTTFYNPRTSYVETWWFFVSKYWISLGKSFNHYREISYFLLRNKYYIIILIFPWLFLDTFPLSFAPPFAIRCIFVCTCLCLWRRSWLGHLPFLLFISITNKSFKKGLPNGLLKRNIRQTKYFKINTKCTKINT